MVETGTLYPVKSAKVTVRTADGYEIEAISNFLGLVEVSVPDSSSYTIAISCEGYCPKSLENVILKTESSMRQRCPRSITAHHWAAAWR